jgi:hypothetical protein
LRRLVIRPGAIGDCILSLPAIESLRADYTEVWVASRNVPLVRGFDAVRSIASTGLDLVGLPDLDPPPALMDRLRGFDSIVSWYGANRAEFRAAVAALPFTFLDALPPEGTPIHATDFYLRQCGDKPGGKSPDLSSRFARLGNRTATVREYVRIHPEGGLQPAPGFSPASGGTKVPQRAKARPPGVARHQAASSAERHLVVPRLDCPRPPGGFAVIHPFSGSPRKNWPLENYRQLAAHLGPCQWCAGPEEPLDGAVRFDDLYELACWLASARLYVGNDSGITHLAAAVGTPVIALFGPTDPALWAPRGPRVQVIRMPGDYFLKPMPLRITPSTRWSPGGEKVLSTVNAALAAGCLGNTGAEASV